MWRDGFRQQSRRRALRSGASARQDGFTVAELVIALSILVLTLIALVSLSASSSLMVATSRERAAMLNASAGYLDRVQQMPFSDVGVAGADPTGTLVAQTTTRTPYVVTITPTVTWGRPGEPGNHSLKTVSLAIEAHSVSGGSVMHLTSSVILSPSGIVTASGQTTSPIVVAPDAALTSIGGVAVSPAATPTVSGDGIAVVASATCNAPGAELQYIMVYDGGQQRTAMSAGDLSAVRTWTWDASADREGQHLLSAHAIDTYGNIGLGSGLTVLVDNVAPTPVGSVGSSISLGTTGDLWWTQATDGTDVDGTTPMPARYYLVRVYEQPSGSGPAGSYATWNPVAGWSPYLFTQAVLPTAASPLQIPGLSTFKRYAFVVIASSPDVSTPPSGRQSGPAAVIAVTKSNATGTWTVSSQGSGKNRQYQVSAAVSVQSPTFPWSGAAQTTVYRLTSDSQPIESGTPMGSFTWASPEQAAHTFTDSPISQWTSAPLANYYYAAVTSITPYGDGGGTPAKVSSCVLVPPGTNTSSGAMGQEWQW